MKSSSAWFRAGRGVLAGSLVCGLALAGGASSALTGVPSANPKSPGIASPNVLSPDLVEVVVAQGSQPIENQSELFAYYGYNGDGPMVPLAGTTTEATKTEPDKNTYLILDGQHGGDAKYNYGTHFLFQGHESGYKDASVAGGEAGYITRINLDADGAHRVTLLASKDTADKPLPDFDGSTWNPFAERLLFTAELGKNGGVWQATVDYPSTVENISSVTGRGGYEGIQNDGDGNLWIVEDVGGGNGDPSTHAKQPNSFVYRFVPKDRRNLKAGGKLQALQVQSQAHAGPIVFHANQAEADVQSQDVKDLHTYGLAFHTAWVTIHDTETDGFTPFDANALAKSHDATPFKRPENGMFRPKAKFTEFFFTETGDTNALAEAGEDHGGFGALFRLVQSSAAADTGRLDLFFLCDVEHTGLDNLAFLSDHLLIAVEDAGDTLHGQRNALDSAYLFDTKADYSNPSTQPLRILAQGRDASATLDSSLGSVSGFQNDGDNEITGIHVSDGDASVRGILGSKSPKALSNDESEHAWRVFYTQQHGDNVTYEILRASQPARD